MRSTDDIWNWLPVIHRDEIILEEELGRGACGIVYKGKCRHATVAVKILHPPKNDEELEKFWKEVSIMLQIRHPNVLNIMGACTDPKNCLIVTEFLPNKDLQHILDKAKSNSETVDKSFALKIAQDIATGMHWLHCSQPLIIHRDLKPANVLIDQYNNAKIADFGLSFINQEIERIDKKLAGSPLWMAPEALELKPPKPSVDVYSFSIILFQLVTSSNLPYNITKYRGDVTLFVKDIIHNKKRPKLTQDIPSPLVKLIEKGWNHNPDERPTFGEIITELKYMRCLSNLHYDEAAIKLWTSYFGTEITANVDTLCSAIFAAHSFTVPEIGSKDQELIQKYNCLHTLVRDYNLEVTNKNLSVTTIHRFGLLLIWFGPFQSPTGQSSFLDKMYLTMRENWFHGDISRETATALLKTQSEKQHYGWLVRTSDNPSYPFTISRIVENKDKILEFNHLRISYNKEHNKFTLEKKGKNNIKQIFEGSTVSELIKLTKSIFQLKRAYVIQRQRYNEIFVLGKDIINTVGYEGE